MRNHDKQLFDRLMIDAKVSTEQRVVSTTPATLQIERGAWERLYDFVKALAED